MLIRNNYCNNMLHNMNQIKSLVTRFNRNTILLLLLLLSV